MQLRQILRALGKTSNGKIILKNILFKYRHKLSEREFCLLEHTYIEKVQTLDTASRLGLSISHYHNILNNALGKLEALIDDEELRKIIENL